MSQQSSLERNTESQSLTPTALINLFELDLSPIGDPTQLFFVDATSAGYQPIVFNGVSYFPFPCQLKAAGYNGQGSIVRPELSVSNINGFVSNLLLQNQDLVGATLIWTRVFARFIDAVNFPNGVSPYTPDPTAAYAPEVYYVYQKKSENQQSVVWEMATSFELDGRNLPSRTVLANSCVWRYREVGTCGYSGPPIADVNNNLFSGPQYGFNALNNRGTWSATNVYSKQDYITIFSTNQSLLNVPLVYVCLNNGVSGQQNSPLIAGSNNWINDGCGKMFTSCRIRFPYPQPLPIGTFVGVARKQLVQGVNTNSQ